MLCHVLGESMAHKTVSSWVPYPGTGLPYLPDFVNPLHPWIYGWGGQKWPKVMLPHVLGGDMAQKIGFYGTSLP